MWISNWLLLCYIPVILISIFGCSTPDVVSVGSSNNEYEQKKITDAPRTISPTSHSKQNQKIDSTYELLGVAKGPYFTGSIGKFDITIRPLGIYHINQKFPTSLQVKTPKTLSFFKTTLQKADAENFSEQKVQFSIPFTPIEKGQHEVEVKVAFAVCTEKTCIPVQKKVVVTLPVN